MKKIKITTRKAYYIDGKIHHSQSTSQIKDVQKYFDNICFDAEMLAKNANGSVEIQRTENTLYVNYKTSNTDLIDKMIIAEK